jgi:hypothetical protein
LSDDYSEDWKEICCLAKLEDDASLTKLTRYVMEGCRIVSSAAGVLRKCAKDIVVDDGGTKVSCTAGDSVFIDLVSPQSIPRSRTNV